MGRQFTVVNISKLSPRCFKEIFFGGASLKMPKISTVYVVL